MKFKLYLDESGTPSPSFSNHHFPYFILSGLITTQEQSIKLKEGADRIKYKYWGNNFPSVVFHSQEIGKRNGNFDILRDPTVEKEFHKDLHHFLTGNGVKCIIVSVDKTGSLAKGETLADIYNKGAKELLNFFISYIISKKSRGEVIIESAGSKTDLLFYQNYIYFLASGMLPLGVDHKKIKKVLTSISFVSKNNYDIETQIADLLAYPAGFQCLINKGVKTLVPNSYEEKMCLILKNKIITMNGDSSFIEV